MKTITSLARLFLVCLAILVLWFSGVQSANAENTDSVKNTDSAAPVVCNPGDDYLPDPENKNHFYQCSNGVPYRMPCPNGLVFDPSAKPGPVCVWPRDLEGR